MKKRNFGKGLFIFRRDLRINDNSALIAALNDCEIVIPIFIFDPIQIGAENKFRSLNAIQFMIESLQDLFEQFTNYNGRLFLFFGDTHNLIEKIIYSEKINAVYVNFDYTRFSIERDKKIEILCKKNKIPFFGYHDSLLIGDPNLVKTTTKKPYLQFNSFLKNNSKLDVAFPKYISKVNNFYLGKIENEVNHTIYQKILTQYNNDLKVSGGTKSALKILKKIDVFSNYNIERDYPALDATTHLSAAHKFGTISIRESYHAIKKKLGTSSQLIKELYWRDFFTYIAYYFPKVFGAPFYEKYKKLEWSTNEENFKLWCDGNTGYPIVDAGMRQLNKTGWMHNRTRMIVASFLVKLMHINWQWGEQYFATRLVDYDPAVNNGNWQWIASIGANAQPYFRIFNPWLQQKKYDPNCIYIKKWLPELRKLPDNIIHSWYKNYQKYDVDYTKPILNYEQEKAVGIEKYKKINK